MFKIDFDFYGVSDIPQRQFRVRLCTYISEKNLGALLGACVLNRANTVFASEVKDFLFELNQGIRKYGPRSDTKEQ